MNGPSWVSSANPGLSSWPCPVNFEKRTIPFLGGHNLQLHFEAVHSSLFILPSFQTPPILPAPNPFPSPHKEAHLNMAAIRCGRVVYHGKESWLLPLSPPPDPWQTRSILLDPALFLGSEQRVPLLVASHVGPLLQNAREVSKH